MLVLLYRAINLLAMVTAIGLLYTLKLNKVITGPFHFLLQKLNYFKCSCEL